MIIDDLKPLEIDINKPLPDPVNARTGHDLDVIAASLSLYGQRTPIVINRKSNIVLKGNGTLQGAKRLGWQTIAAVFVDDDPTTATGYSLADNRAGELSRWDNEILAQLLSAQDDPADVPGFSQADLDELIAEVGGALDELMGDEGQIVEDEPQIDKAEELQQTWQVQTGDLWQLGRHRLICGDCTDKAVIDRLMDGERAEMGFTSPPYNAGNSKTGAYHGGSANRNDYKQMYNHDMDNLAQDDYKDFLINVLIVASLHLDYSAVFGWNICYNAKSRRAYGEVVFSEKNPLPVQETVIWDKSLGMNISANNVYSRTAEFVFLLSKTEKYRSNQNGGVYWNIWRISNRDGDNMQNSHGASFPVALPSKCIEQHTKPNQLVYDPFLGSGTTLIASHQLNRICYGSEISPKYCAVILQRYADLTGETPIKL